MVATNEKLIEKYIVNCKDTDSIPKVFNAGQIIENDHNQLVQVMHNGVLVLADSYYGDFHTEIIRKLRGHHEPQEEKVFFEVMKLIPSEATMIELGCYWSYYSLWFQQVVDTPRSYMVDAIKENLDLGKQNFEINNRKGEFIHALIGSKLENSSPVKTISVDSLISSKQLKNVDILHVDIQGHEYEMLLGSANSIKNKIIKFIFISTHGLIVHYKCRKYLEKNKYFVIAEHTNVESYSCDGLIVAISNIDDSRKINISKKDISLLQKIKSLLANLTVTTGLVK